MDKLAACRTVGEAKEYLNQFDNAEPFESERLGTLFYVNKGIVYALTWHYLCYRARQFIRDLTRLDAERLSTILFITIVSWLLYLLFSLLTDLAGVKLPDISAVVIAGLYASAIAGGAKGAMSTLKQLKSMK